MPSLGKEIHQFILKHLRIYHVLLFWESLDGYQEVSACGTYKRRVGQQINY